MLACVLLYVVEAALPIDASVDRTGGDRAIGDVQHRVVAFAIDHFQHTRVTERTGVIGLAARGRIKRGSVEDYLPSIACGLASKHLRVKFPEKES